MSRLVPFFVVDAFTETLFQGNPGGVFLEGEQPLTNEQCQRLCREVSLESAFVQKNPTSEADYRLRYYTGVTEVPFCGHATVAAMTALYPSDSSEAVPESLRLATGVGILGVQLTRNSAGFTEVTLHQIAPTFGTVLSSAGVAEVAEMLGIAPGAIQSTRLPAQIVSTGTPWLLVPVDSRAAVDRNFALKRAADIAALSKRNGTFGIYLFTAERTDDGLSIWSRCFAPLADIPEDPVTGSASGALGGYLAENGVLSVEEGAVARVVSRQGFAGVRGGTVEIQVRRENDRWRPAVKGTAVIAAQGVFTLP